MNRRFTKEHVYNVIKQSPNLSSKQKEKLIAQIEDSLFIMKPIVIKAIS